MLGSDLLISTCDWTIIICNQGPWRPLPACSNCRHRQPICKCYRICLPTLGHCQVRSRRRRRYTSKCAVPVPWSHRRYTETLCIWEVLYLNCIIVFDVLLFSWQKFNLVLLLLAAWLLYLNRQLKSFVFISHQSLSFDQTIVRYLPTFVIKLVSNWTV